MRHDLTRSACMVQVAAREAAKEAAKESAEALRAKGINPRTGTAYVRGGAYNKDKSNSVAGNLSQVAALERANAKDGTLRAEVKRLKAENARLTQALEVAQNQIAAAKENCELVKKAAMLEASQQAAEQMLQRYRDGLRDGASLSTGSVRLSSSTTPDSAGLGGSPATFNSLGSF